MSGVFFTTGPVADDYYAFTTSSAYGDYMSTSRHHARPVIMMHSEHPKQPPNCNGCGAPLLSHTSRGKCPYCGAAR
jgi:rubrerythrin